VRQLGGIRREGGIAMERGGIKKEGTKEQKK
jgi:hypothetical protein